MARAGSMTGKARRTFSRRQIMTLADAAKTKGCTARLVFPDGVRIELTPVDQPEQAETPPEGSFTNLQ